MTIFYTLRYPLGPEPFRSCLQVSFLTFKSPRPKIREILHCFAPLLTGEKSLQIAESIITQRIIRTFIQSS